MIRIRIQKRQKGLQHDVKNAEPYVKIGLTIALLILYFGGLSLLLWMVWS